MIRHLKRFARPILATILLAMTHGPWAVAQGVDPSPEQLAIFQGLSPEQQESVLRQMSERESGTGGATDRQVTTSDRNARPVRPTDSARRGSDVQGGELAEPRIPVFKAEDTLLVQIDLPQAFRQPPQQNQVNPLAQAPGQLQQPQARMPVEPLPVEPEEIDEREQTKREELRDLIRSRNPYRLDRNGQLNLPGFPPIALGGLTEQQATQRLAEEPGIRGTTVRIVRLPVNRIGLEGLKRFGYDLFEEPSSAFSPVTDAPVPANYTVGPGDELNVQLFGGQNRNLRLTVARDGTVSFPGLGPISVTGMTFARAKDAIESRVSEQMIGVRANVAMGDLRAIRVFVLGETRQPGSYSVSGMATMTTALFASGGVKPIGSLRNIQLKRRGTVVRSLDLYDLLIAGDTSDDSQLQPGDVIFIPPAGSTVSIDGEVQRPAIYELSGEATVSDVLRMAGGLTAEADPGRASLTRIDPESRRVVMEIDLRNGTRASQALRNGDVLRVSRLRPQVDLGVTLNHSVCSNGAVTIRLEEDHPRGYAMHDVKTFDPSEVLTELIEHLPNAHFAVEHADGSYRFHKPFPSYALGDDNREAPLSELLEHPVSRVVVLSPEHDVDQFLGLMSKIGLQSVSYAIGYTAWLDIAPKGIDKGHALEQLRQHYEIPGERTLVMGDGRNDIEMFRWARSLGGYAYAMGQAPEEVKLEATAVTAAVDQDGVAQVLEALEGLKFLD